MNQRPLAIGLILCEQVVLEENTRNSTLVNCFARRKVEGFPSRPFPFVVYANLVDGKGSVDLEVRIESLDNLEMILQRSTPVTFKSPLQEVRCFFRIANCSFPRAGHYEVKLLADSEMIASRRLNVFLPEGGPK